MRGEAGAEGVEPSSAVLETDVRPFNYAPKYCVVQDQRIVLYIITASDVNNIF